MVCGASGNAEDAVAAAQPNPIEHTPILTKTDTQTQHQKTAVFALPVNASVGRTRVLVFHPQQEAEEH